MAANWTANTAGGAITFSSTDVGSGVEAANVRVCDATAANFMPTGDAAARKIYVTLTDGTGTAAFDNTNTTPKVSNYGKGSVAGDTAMPSMDTIAHAGFQEITDGATGPVFVTPASTAAVAGNKALVVALHPTSPATTNADSPVTAGTAPAKGFLIDVQFLAWGSLPACTTAQVVALQGDATGTVKIGKIALGTPIYNGASSGGAASAVATLTIPAAKMGFLDGFDIDGLGATAGSAISVTIAGLLGGTLTYTVGIPAGVTVPYHQSFRFDPPLQASAVNTNIVITCPSFGSGNTASTVNAYGHYL
jgi:hypothetical protein